jgi:hypothetical protein
MTPAAEPVSVLQLALTAGASLLGTLAAAIISFRFAMVRLKRERAFERRLSWHESAIKSLTEFNRALLGAVHAERHEHPSEDERIELWTKVATLAATTDLQLEAEMYASPPAYLAICKASEDRRAMLTLGLDFVMSDDPAKRDQGLKLMEIAAKAVLHAASRLASDVREQLALKRIKREPRLYDEKQLKAAESHGQDYKARFRALRARSSGTPTQPKQQKPDSGGPEK